MFESLTAKESLGLQVCTLTPMDAWPAQAARLTVKRAAQQKDLTRQVQAHFSICGRADQEVAVGDSTPFSRNPLNPRPTPLGHTEGPSSMMSIKLVAQEPGTSGLISHICTERFV